MRTIHGFIDREEWVDVSCGSGKTRRARKEEINIHSEVIQLSGEALFDFMKKILNSKSLKMHPNYKRDEAGLRWLVYAKLDVPWGGIRMKEWNCLCIRRKIV